MALVAQYSGALPLHYTAIHLSDREFPDDMASSSPPRLLASAASKKSQDDRKHVSKPKRASTKRDDVQERPMAFISGLRDHQTNSDRTLIRTHVMREVVRQKQDPNHEFSTAVTEPHAVSGKVQKFRISGDQFEPFKTARETRKLEKSSRRSSPPTLGTDGPQTLQKLDPLVARTENWLRQVESSKQSVNDDDLLYVSPHDMEQRSLSRLDPFDSFPVKINPWTEAVIEQYCLNDHACWCPAVNNEWFQSAMVDPALYHATFWHYAAHGMRYLGRGAGDESVEQLTHQFEAIRIVNERLDHPEEGISDETMMAVACIASVETCFSSIEASDVHIAGLNQIIALRGGYDLVKHNEMLNRLLYWIDEIRAARRDTLLSLPTFSPKVSVLREHKHVELDNSPLPPFDPNVLDPTFPNFLSTIRTQIDALTTHLHLHPRNSFTNTNRMLLADRFMILERDLLSFIHTLNVSLTTHKFHTTNIKTAAIRDLISAISLLLQTQLPLRGMVPMSLVLAHHGRRLYELLSLLPTQIGSQHDASQSQEDDHTPYTGQTFFKDSESTVMQAEALTLTLGALACYTPQSGVLREKEWFINQLVQLPFSHPTSSPPSSLNLSSSSTPSPPALRSSQSPPRSQRQRQPPQRQRQRQHGREEVDADNHTATRGAEKKLDWIDIRVLRAEVRHYFELGTGIDVLVDRIWDEVFRRLATVSM